MSTGYTVGMAESNFYVEKDVVKLPGSEVVVRDDKARTPFKEIGALGEVKPDSKLERGRSLRFTSGGEENTHGREIVEEESRNKVLWGDVYGGWFAARGEKGGRWYKNRIREFNDLSKNIFLGEVSFRFEGMYNEKEADYLVRVTDFLARNGILTEKIRVVEKLNTVVDGDEVVEVDEFKRRRISEVKKTYGENSSGYKDACKYIEEANFVEVERDLQVAERIRDLARCKTEDEFKKVLSGVFEVINLVAKVKDTSTLPNTNPPERFDINKEEDIKRYLKVWLPSQMGIYLARLRKMEMTNDFSHAQQWSLVGTEYDAQSFIGRGFVRDCKEEDYSDAMMQSIRSLGELFGTRNNYIENNYKGLGEATANLIKEYIKEIGYRLEDLDYSFMVNNSYFSMTGAPLFSPSDWNRLRKRVDPDFIPTKKETLKNWGTVMKLHAKFQGQFLGSVPRSVVDSAKRVAKRVIG